MSNTDQDLERIIILSLAVALLLLIMFCFCGVFYNIIKMILHQIFKNDDVIETDIESNPIQLYNIYTNNIDKVATNLKSIKLYHHFSEDIIQQSKRDTHENISI